MKTAVVLGMRVGYFANCDPPIHGELRWANSSKGGTSTIAKGI